MPRYRRQRGRLHSEMSGGSLDGPLQRHWFAEADECSDDTPRRLSIGPNSGEASKALATSRAELKVRNPFPSTRESAANLTCARSLAGHSRPHFLIFRAGPVLSLNLILRTSQGSLASRRSASARKRGAGRRSRHSRLTRRGRAGVDGPTANLSSDTPRSRARSASRREWRRRECIRRTSLSPGVGGERGFISSESSPNPPSPRPANASPVSSSTILDNSP